MTRILLLSILILIVSACDQIDPQKKNEELIQAVTINLKNAGLFLEISRICPQQFQPAHHVDKKQGNRTCNIFSNSTSSFWSFSELYPLSNNQTNSAYDFIKKHQDFKPTHSDHSKNKTILNDTSQVHSHPKRIILEYNLQKTKCAIYLSHNEMLKFASCYKKLFQFKAQNIPCNSIRTLEYFEEIPFFNNQKFNFFYQKSNLSEKFYRMIAEVLDSSPNHIKMMKKSSNILIIRALENAIDLNNRGKISAAHSLLSSISILSTKFDLLSLPYKEALDSLNKFDDMLITYEQQGHTLSYLFITNYSHDIHTLKRAYQAQRDLERARIMTALAIYYKTHDNYPDTLDQLAPDILKQIPANPMTDKPFKYTLPPNGEYELSDE